MTLTDTTVRTRLANVIRTFELCRDAALTRPDMHAGVLAANWYAAIDVVQQEFADYLKDEA